MPILYRHFMLVALILTAVGALAATLIQETRRPVTSNLIELPDTGGACEDGRHCETDFAFSASKTFS